MGVVSLSTTEKTEITRLNILICSATPSHFPKRQNLQPSKLKKFTDNNFKLHENGEKFSQRVENTVGKGEIARYEQFLLFPLRFQKTFIADT